MAAILTCKALIEILDDYFDGLQSDDVRREFERHLQACRHCRTYLESYQATVRVAAALRPENPDCGDVPEELVRAIVAARTAGAT